MAEENKEISPALQQYLDEKKITDRYGPHWGSSVILKMKLDHMTYEQAVLATAKEVNAPGQLKRDADSFKIDPVLRAMGYSNWNDFQNKRLNRDSDQYWAKMGPHQEPMYDDDGNVMVDDEGKPYTRTVDELWDEAVAAGIIKPGMNEEQAKAAYDRFKQQLFQMDQDYYREGLVKEYEKENPTQSLLMKIVYPNLYSRITDDIRTGEGPTSWGDMGAGDIATMAADVGANVAPTLGGVSGNAAFKLAGRGKLLPTSSSNTLRMALGGAEGGAWDLIGRAAGTDNDVGLTDLLEVPLMASLNAVATRSAAKKLSNVVEDAGNMGPQKVAKSKNILKQAADVIENAGDDPVLAAGDELAAIMNDVPEIGSGIVTRDELEKLRKLRQEYRFFDPDPNVYLKEAENARQSAVANPALQAELEEQLKWTPKEHHEEQITDFWGDKINDASTDIQNKISEKAYIKHYLDRYGLFDDATDGVWDRLVHSNIAKSALPGAATTEWSLDKAIRADQAQSIVEAVLSGRTPRKGYLADNPWSYGSDIDALLKMRKDFPALAEWYEGLKVNKKTKNPNTPIKKTDPRAVFKVAEPGIAGNVIKSAVLNPLSAGAYDVGRYNLVTVPNMEDSEGKLEQLLKQKPDGIRAYATGASQFILPNDQALTPTELKLLETMNPSNETLLQSINELEKERKQSEKPKFRTGTAAAGIRG